MIFLPGLELRNICPVMHEKRLPEASFSLYSLGKNFRRIGEIGILYTINAIVYRYGIK